MDNNKNPSASRFKLKRSVFDVCYVCPSRPSVEPATVAILKIMGYLDSRSRSTCRLVCHSWKKVVDEEIGLRVKVNEKKYGKENGTFCRSVLLERLTVEHLNKFRNFVTLKYPENLKMLNCIGPTDSVWFKGQLLTKCRNLVRIDLSGRFLQSQELSPRQSWIDVNKVTPSGECDSSSKICHQITLAQLKSLIISYSHADYETYHHKVNGCGPLQAIWGTILGSRFEATYLLKQVIDTNVTFILDTIRSMSLRTLYIAVDGMQLDEDKSRPGWTYRWKNEPLKHFLEAHRHSLRRLYLPHYRGDTRREERTFPLFPCDLMTFEISLIQKGDRKNTRFMEKLLLVQTELEELRLVKHYVGHGLTLFPSLVSVIPANASTLTFIHLKVTVPDKEFLDGRVFASCRVLQTLLVERVHDHVTFRNVTSLPATIRHIQIHVPVWLGCSEVSKVKDLRCVQTLVLDDLLFEATGANKGLQLLQFVKKLLLLRQLDHLHIDIQDDGTDAACPILNGVIQALHGTYHEASNTKAFSFLQIYPGRNCGPGTTIDNCHHFLDSDPLFRTVLDPSQNHSLIKDVKCVEIVVKSNIFQQATSEDDEDDESDGDEKGDLWCEFCFSLFDL